MNTGYRPPPAPTQPKAAQTSSSTKAGQPQGQISEYALTPYTPEGYPNTFEKFGSRMEEIERYRRMAAEASLINSKCNNVELVELSTSKSRLSNLVFWVDCSDGERIYLSEAQLDKNTYAITESQKAWNETDARKWCKDAIRESVRLPAELDTHDFLGTAFYLAPTTGIARLTMDFDAKNAYGMELQYTAACTFKPGERSGQIEIAKRP